MGTLPYLPRKITGKGFFLLLLLFIYFSVHISVTGRSRYGLWQMHPLQKICYDTPQVHSSSVYQ